MASKEFVEVAFGGATVIVFGRTVARNPPRLAIGVGDGARDLDFAQAVMLRDFLDRYIDDAEERP